MPIHTLHTERLGNRSIAEVEITSLHEATDAYTAWEHYCELCDDLSSGLTEATARDELANHVCSSMKCTCGYRATSGPDLDGHTIGMAGDNITHQEAR